MPRPKPKNVSPTFISRGHPLSDEVQTELIGLLGFGKVDLLEETVRRQHPGMKILSREPGAPLQLVRDPDFVPSTGPDMGKIILDLERALGLYVHGREHLDNIPRAADYREVFRPIRRAALKLFGTLNNLSEYHREQIDSRGAKFQELRSALGLLAGVSADIVNDFRGKSSAGRGENRALMETIGRLRGIFREYYRGPRTAHGASGAVTSRSIEEEPEEQFVRTALDGAKIKYSNLPRLMGDPRYAPPEIAQHTKST